MFAKPTHLADELTSVLAWDTAHGEAAPVFSSFGSTKSIDPTMPATSLCNDAPILDKLVAEALNQSPHFSRRTVRFETQEGDVVLRGTVRSYYHKQMAQEVLRRVDGVRRIENQLEVDWR